MGPANGTDNTSDPYYIPGRWASAGALGVWTGEGTKKGPALKEAKAAGSYELSLPDQVRAKHQKDRVAADMACGPA